jgi:hypothetical protein
VESSKIVGYQFIQDQFQESILTSNTKYGGVLLLFIRARYDGDAHAGDREPWTFKGKCVDDDSAATKKLSGVGQLGRCRRRARTRTA